MDVGSSLKFFNWELKHKAVFIKTISLFNFQICIDSVHGYIVDGCSVKSDDSSQLCNHPS